MRKVQKTVAILSIVTIVLLGIVLGIFLWKESTQTKTASKSQTGESKQVQANKEEGKGNKVPSEEEPESLAEEQAVRTQSQPIGENKPEQTTQDIIMVFTGDVYLSQYVQNNYDASGIGGVLSDGLLNRLIQADIAMANEEFPFSTGGTPEEDKQFTFRVNPSYTSVLTDMGLDLVTLANNHAMDYGTVSLSDTFEALKGVNLPYVGAGETEEEAASPVYLEAGNRKIGFLGASRVIPDVSWNIENRQPGLFCTYDSTALNAAIEAARPECDYLVVYVHWGIEREYTPEEYQRTLAKGYIDAGADLVIGAHPHVLQGIEYYEGKPIVYSLGNFIFNQEIPKTMLLQVNLSPEGEAALNVVPASASGAFTSEMEADKAAELYSYLESISYAVSIDEEGRVTPQPQ